MKLLIIIWLPSKIKYPDPILLKFCNLTGHFCSFSCCVLLMSYGNCWSCHYGAMTVYHIFQIYHAEGFNLPLPTPIPSMFGCRCSDDEFRWNHWFKILNLSSFICLTFHLSFLTSLLFNIYWFQYKSKTSYKWKFQRLVWISKPK